MLVVPIIHVYLLGRKIVEIVAKLWLVAVSSMAAVDKQNIPLYPVEDGK